MQFKFDLASQQKLADSISYALLKRTPCDQLWQLARDLTSALSDVSHAIGAGSLGAWVEGASRGPHLLRARIEDALHDVSHAIRSRCCNHDAGSAAEAHPPANVEGKRGPQF